MTRAKLINDFELYKAGDITLQDVKNAVDSYTSALLKQCNVSGSYPVEESIKAAQRYADEKMMDGYPAEYEQMMIDAHQRGQLFLRNKFNIELDYGV